MSGADGYARAASGAAAAQHGCTGLGLHARAEAVGFRTVAAVRLKCALGHRDPLLFPKENPPLSNIFEYTVGYVVNPAQERSSRCGKAIQITSVFCRSAEAEMWQAQFE